MQQTILSTMAHNNQQLQIQAQQVTQPDNQNALLVNPRPSNATDNITIRLSEANLDQILIKSTTVMLQNNHPLEYTK